MPSKTYTNKSVTPEQRRRMGMKPKPVFTAAMASDEVRNRFRLKVSILFSLMVAMGIASMWIVAYANPRVSDDVHWFLMGGTIVFFSSTWFLRKSTLGQSIALLLGLCSAGAVSGLNAPQGPSMLPFLLNPTLIIGAPLLGLVASGMFTRKERSQFSLFILDLPWIVLAMIMIWFYPAGETILAISGTVSLLFIILLLLAGTQAQALYRPDEASKAAADVLPLAFSSFSLDA